MTRRSQAVYAVPTLRVYHCSLEEHIYLFPGYPFGRSKRFAFVSSLVDNPYFVSVQNLKCIVRLAVALYLELCFRDKDRLQFANSRLSSQPIVTSRPVGFPFGFPKSQLQSQNPYFEQDVMCQLWLIKQLLT